MNTLTQIKDHVIDLLRATPGLNELKVTPEYSGGVKSSISSPLLVVGIDSVELSPAGLGGYFGESAGTPHQGSWGTVTLRLDCYTHQSNKDYLGHSIFEEICAALMGSGLGISKIYLEPVDNSKTGLSTQLSAKAELQALLTSPAPTSHSISGFIVKRSEENKTTKP